MSTSKHLKEFKDVQHVLSAISSATMRPLISMLKELDWPSLQQRRAEKRMALFHSVVNETVDVETSALMTRTKRSSRKLNRVQYQTHSSEKDCYKYAFVPRSIVYSTIGNSIDYIPLQLLSFH